MILNFKKWSALHEQVTHEVSAMDPEAKKVFEIFNTEYLPTLTGDPTNMTIADYIAKLKTLTLDSFNGAIQFFTDKGYKQPNEAITKLQQYLMSKTEIKTFTTAEDKTEKFDDGKLGRATANALVQYRIIKYSHASDQNKTVGATTATAAQIHQEPGQNVPAAKVATPSDVKTGTGTQYVP